MHSLLLIKFQNILFLVIVYIFIDIFLQIIYSCKAIRYMAFYYFKYIYTAIVYSHDDIGYFILRLSYTISIKISYHQFTVLSSFIDNPSGSSCLSFTCTKVVFDVYHQFRQLHGDNQELSSAAILPVRLLPEASHTTFCLSAGLSPLIGEEVK